MIKKCQIEERLAAAIREYVRLCGRLRRAVSPDEIRVARHAAATARKILKGTEGTFEKVGGDFASMARRLRLAPTAMRAEHRGDTPIGFVPAVEFAADPESAADATDPAEYGTVAE